MSTVVLHPKGAQSRQMPVQDLIGHILTRYHETHRREMPELIALARSVERLHADHPAAPHGLADALSLLSIDLEAHMKREEQELFPALLGQQMHGISPTAEALRHDHDFQEEALRLIGEITQWFVAPQDACAFWRSLYAGVAKLCGDLVEHVRLENEALLAAVEIKAA